MEPNEIDTSDEATTRAIGSICFVPSQYFFVGDCPWSHGPLSPLRRKGSLFWTPARNLAPLPSDQLYWGYYSLPDSNSGILFASSRQGSMQRGLRRIRSIHLGAPSIYARTCLRHKKPRRTHSSRSLERTKSTKWFFSRADQRGGISILKGNAGNDAEATESVPIEIELRNYGQLISAPRH